MVCGGSGAVGSRVAAWERRVAAARATDILRGMRLRRARHLRDSEIHAHDNDHAWMEQGEGSFELLEEIIYALGN